MFARIRPTLLALSNDRRAVTAIEYAFIASLVAVVIFSAVSQIGSHLVTIFNTVASCF